jgi:hypothetical protein
MRRPIELILLVEVLNARVLQWSAAPGYQSRERKE